MVECETRTQGARIAALFVRLRTQDRADQRGRAARASFRGEFLAGCTYRRGRAHALADGGGRWCDPTSDGDRKAAEEDRRGADPGPGAEAGAQAGARAGADPARAGARRDLSEAAAAGAPPAGSKAAAAGGM